MKAPRYKTLVANCPVMLKPMETVRRIAPSDLPVLITGEGGSGKEVIARHIHQLSARAEAPFIAGRSPITCWRENFSDMKKGSYRLLQKIMGLLEVATNGTVFLDEIGEMTLQLQVQLLLVIETGTSYRLGGTLELRVNMRIIAAANTYIKSAAERGYFRADLYYRLATMVIDVTALRERTEDLLLLIEHFIWTDPHFSNKKFKRDALDVLLHFSWPGN